MNLLLLRFAAFICVALLFQSCATFLNGKDPASIYIGTTPKGATVTVNGKEQGKTPMHLVVKPKLKKTEVVLSYPDAKQVTFRLTKKFVPISIFNLVNWFGWIIDLSTAAIVEYSPTYYHFDLEFKEMEKTE